jgi:hypothetical protein
MPRNPATWTRPDPIDAIEAQLPVQEMVDDAVARTEKLRIEPDA